MIHPDHIIHIVVNGKETHVETGALLSDVLGERGVTVDTAQGIAVALNDKIVRRFDWSSTPLSSGAHIEIVTARQGG